MIYIQTNNTWVFTLSQFTVYYTPKELFILFWAWHQMYWDVHFSWTVVTALVMSQQQFGQDPSSTWQCSGTQSNIQKERIDSCPVHTAFSKRFGCSSTSKCCFTESSLRPGWRSSETPVEALSCSLYQNRQQPFFILLIGQHGFTVGTRWFDVLLTAL